MQRKWTDGRDGRIYRVVVEQLLSAHNTGQAPVVSGDSWKLWFHSEDAPNIEIAPDTGQHLSELPDRDLQRMLDKARGWVTVDVDEEPVTFFVHPAGQPMETPPGAEPAKGPPHPLVLSGRGMRSAAMLAKPSPKDRIEDFDVDELRALWRQWIST